MKKLQVVRWIFSGALLWVVLTGSELGRATDDNVGSTGAPLEPQTCANCHNSGAAFGTVSLTIEVFFDGTNTPVAAYTPGTLYDMRVTVNNSMGSPQGRGFQMTCLTFPGNAPLAGYSALASNVQQITLTTGTWAGRTYVEQPTMSVSNQFTFSWTAPPAGTGAVRFYAAGNAVNGNNSSGGDRSGSATLTLSELLPLAVVSATVADVGCNGDANGSIALTLSGGITPYTYLWSDGNTSEDRFGLGPGAYSVVVTDNAGNTVSGSWTITEPPLLEASVSVNNPIFPGEDGVALFTLDGGEAPYQIAITGIGTFSSTEVFLPGGTYGYTVTDSNGCLLSGSLTVVAPEPLSLSAALTPVSCFGLSDGAIALTVSGATPPYALQWSNGSSESLLSGLPAGNYALTLTDAVGYVYQDNFTVLQPAPLAGVAATAGIACFGQTALVTVSASGGTPPYTGTTAQFLPPGAYTYLITDANGCNASVSVSLEQPSLLQAEATSAEISCFGDSGIITVSASGGTPPYQGTGDVVVTTPGSTTYTVTDASGCQAIAVSVVAAIDGPSMQVQTGPAICAGQCNGTASVSFANLQLPYTFVWSDGVGDELRNDLCPSTYTATLTDASGCTIVSSVMVPAPPPLVFTLNADPVLCFGDSTMVDIVVTGNQGDVQFFLDGEPSASTWQATGGAYTVAVTDEAGCSAQWQTEIMQPSLLFAEPLAAAPLCAGGLDGSISLDIQGGTGDYTVSWSGQPGDAVIEGIGQGVYPYSITDQNGCALSGEVVLESPEALTVEVELEGAGDGTALVVITPSGGTPPYSVAWSNGLTGSSVVLSTGTYTATVSDGNGCLTETEAVVVPVSVTPVPEDAPLVRVDYANTQLHVRAEGAVETEVYDSRGKRVLRSQEKVLSLLPLRSGLYVVVVKSMGLQHISKVVLP